MSSNLSRREKSMLYGLLLFALAAAVVYFILMPGLARNAGLRNDIAALQALADQRDAVHNAADTARGQMAALEADIAALEAGLLPAMAAYEADRMVTGLLESTGLTIVSLTVGEAEARAVPPFVPADFALSAYAANDGAAFAALAEDAPRLVCRTIEATATGGLDNLASLLDAAAEVDGLALTTVGYTAAGNGTYTFTLGFEMYSYAHAE